MNIKFCGAAREVTGSAHLITLSDGYTILLDCGLYQGRNKEMEDFNRTFQFDVNQVDCMILSHAHIDHSGRVPFLVKEGFKGNIYATHATRSLCSIMLLDSAVIQTRDAEYHNKKNKDKIKPLYTRKDVKQTMNQFVGLSYNRWHYINEHVKLYMTDAGHILGSATVTLEIDDYGHKHRIGFTGDIGRPERPILRDPQPMPKVEHLICESTYGAKDHNGVPQDKGQLLKVIEEICVKNKGKLLIPAFSVGRTQEIVYMLDQLENEGLLPHIPVYVDSPLAVNATNIYGSHPECYDADLQEYMIADPNPFGFNGLNYIREVEGSKALNHSKEPCIIISASGMMTAGRIVHHAMNNIGSSKNGVLIVGYCAPYTLGGQIRAGKKQVNIFGQRVNVNAKVFIMDSFSAHADRSEITAFLQNQKKSLRNLFLVHGNYDAQQELEKRLNAEGFDNVHIPELGSEFRV